MDLNQNGVDFPELDDILIPADPIGGFDMSERNLDDLASWIDEQNIDDVPTPSPLGAMVDDMERFHVGQWQQIEELSRTGSKMIKAEIERLWNEMATNPAFGVSIWTFRKTFADFIEQKCWRDIDVTENYPGSNNLKKATFIVSQLHSEVKQKLQDLNMGVLHATPDFRMHLQKWDEDFMHNYSAYPLEVVKLMQEILTEEQKIIAIKQSQEDAGWPGTAVNAMPQNMYQMLGGQEGVDEKFARSNEITRVISELERRNQSGATVISNLIQRVQQLQVWTDENLAIIDRYDIDQLNPELQRKWREIKQRRDFAIQEKKRMLDECHIQPLENAKNVLAQVLDNALGEWQRDQAYLNNGKIVTTFCTLPQLESWCKRLAKLINNNLHQMSELQRLEQALGPASAHVLISQQYRKDGTQEQVQINAIEYLSREYSTLLQKLVEKGLVVEKHPPQVLMKDKRFQCQLRHLVGDSLDIHQVPFEVEAWLLNAEQATNVLPGGHVTSFGATGKILNSTARSDFIDHLRQLSINMRNMCLKMQQRGANRNAEMVAELKFVMLFRARIPLRFPSPNQPVYVVAQTMSLPIVVISHGKQEADAQATIFWDNAFARMGRKPFEIDDSVSWAWMLEALDCRWKKECEENGKAVGLTDSAKEYLTMKLFNEKRVPSTTMISWKKFNHDKMFQCGETRRELFTFWTWFFKAMELVSSVQVKKYWNAGIIHGFLSKADCQRMLQDSGTHGVFLFRFSETKLGALSISCYRNLNGKLMVCHLEPDVLKNFIVRSLPDMVFDLEYLRFLYPDRPKDFIFGSFRGSLERATNNPSSDYLQKEFKVTTKDEESWRIQDPLVKPPSPNGFPTDTGGGDHLAMDDSSEN